VPQQTVSAGNNVDITFAFVPPGIFLMGSPKGEEEDFGRDPVGVWNNASLLSPITHDDELQHRVILTRGYYLGIHQVTQAQWQAVMGSNPSKFKGAELPVESVSWDDCQEFCERLSQKAGKRFRLPTEAEWEYACRAGTTTPFFFGPTIFADQANFAGGLLGTIRMLFTGRTTPVGKFAPNAWGLFDMHGNVDEWCQDWYGSYPTDQVSDPTGPDSGSTRVWRGGECQYPARDCRAANRASSEPALRGHFFGCRVCLCLE
jgi:formylglycine-generating enzyme required for sulfatase activity